MITSEFLSDAREVFLNDFSNRNPPGRILEKKTEEIPEKKPKEPSLPTKTTT